MTAEKKYHIQETLTRKRRRLAAVSYNKHKESAMFFKMLKSDLKQKKGLNVILFIFISVASMLVFAGSVQIFSNLTRESTAKKLCRTSDTQILIPIHEFNDETLSGRVAEFLDKDPNVRSWSTSEMLKLSSGSMDYPDFDEKNISYKYLSNFGCKIALFCNDPSEYSMLMGNCKIKNESIPGRCIIEKEKKLFY